jgi:hypothetical protein
MFCNRIVILFLITSFVISPLSAQVDTRFKYQGRLVQNGQPSVGTFDLAFDLFGDAAGSTLIGSTCVNDVAITDGLFTVQLDFGEAFVDADRWLGISVREDTGAACDAITGTYTALVPLQKITATPQAQYAAEAGALIGGIDDADADPANELQTLTFTSPNLTIEDGNSVDLSAIIPPGSDGHSLDAVDGAPVNALFVDGEGQVGIGTTSPTELLEIDGGNILQTPGDPVLVGSLNIGGGPNSIYVSGRYSYIVDSISKDLKVVDVSDPTSPTLIGSLGIGDGPLSVYVSGRYAYVTDRFSDDLKVIDVSNPGSPTLSGSLVIGNSPFSVNVSGHFAYIIDNELGELNVIDVSNPTSPVLSSSLDVGPDPQSIYVSGRYAYICDNDTDDLRIVDISDPTSPTLAGSLGIGERPQSIYVSGPYAYVIHLDSGGLKVINVSNPNVPVEIGSLDIGTRPFSVYVSGRYAYIIDLDSVDLKVIDVSNPSALQLVSSVNIGEQPVSFYVSGRYAYVIDRISDELKIFDISGGEMTSLIVHSLEAGNLQVRNDIIAQGQLQVTGGITAGAGGIFSGGDVGVAGNLKTTGTVEAYNFIGDGSMLTGLFDNVDDADSSPTNELQTLSFASPNLSISDGNSVDLSSLQDGVTDADADPTNELNTGARLAGTALELSDAGGTLTVELASLQDGVLDPDADPTNELLALAILSGTDLQLADAGGTITVDLSSLQDGVVDGDADSNNEIQTLAFTSPNLSISGSNSVDLSALQDGTIDADADPTNELNTNLQLSGMNLQLSDAGGTLTADLSPLAGSLIGDGHSLNAADGDPIDALFVNDEGLVGVGTPAPDAGVDIQVGGAVLSLNELGVALDNSQGGPFNRLGGALDVFVSGNIAYVTSFVDHAMTIIDISNPAAPAELGIALDNSQGGSFSRLENAFRVVVSGSRAYITGEDAMTIIDVSNPAVPAQLGIALDDGRGGTFGRLDGPHDVFIVGNTAYVAARDDDALTIIDITNPAALVELGVALDNSQGGSFSRLDGATGVFLLGNIAYVTSLNDDALTIIDVSNPAAPIELGVALDDSQGGTFSRLDGATSVFVSGTIAYVTASLDDAVTIIDVSNPANPVELGVALDDSFGGPFARLNNCTDIVVVGSTAYAISRNDRALTAIDVSNPVFPIERDVVFDDSFGGSIINMDDPISVFVSNDTAYVPSVTGDSLSIIDVSVQLAPLGLRVAGDAQFNRDVTLTNGTMTATNFIGDGSMLTGLPRSGTFIINQGMVESVPVAGSECFTVEGLTESDIAADFDSNGVALADSFILLPRSRDYTVNSIRYWIGYDNEATPNYAGTATLTANVYNFTTGDFVRSVSVAQDITNLTAGSWRTLPLLPGEQIIANTELLSMDFTFDQQSPGMNGKAAFEIEATEQ